MVSYLIKAHFQSANRFGGFFNPIYKYILHLHMVLKHSSTKCGICDVFDLRFAQAPGRLQLQTRTRLQTISGTHTQMHSTHVLKKHDRGLLTATFVIGWTTRKCHKGNQEQDQGYIKIYSSTTCAAGMLAAQTAQNFLKVQKKIYKEWGQSGTINEHIKQTEMS